MGGWCLRRTSRNQRSELIGGDARAFVPIFLSSSSFHLLQNPAACPLQKRRLRSCSGFPQSSLSRMFQPKNLKQAKLLHKGVTRFLNYKKDLLPPAKLEEIEKLRDELKAAIKARDARRIESLTADINRTCEKALPQARNSELAENIEVFFVSIVIALGIRTYIAQPFQIPTGSMQPTLSGITAEYTKESPRHGLFHSFLGWFKGETYLNVVSDHDGQLIEGDPVTEHSFFIFRRYSKLHFKDGHTITIKCPKGQLIMDLHLQELIGARLTEHGADTPDQRTVYGMRNDGIGGINIQKGQLLARGIVRNGDHVIVNKFAYHFRRPTRGEVFVFTTKNIRGIEASSSFDARMGSQHYIKRLVGVPGDTMDLDAPELLVNGQPATEPGIRRVIDKAGGPEGYRGYSGRHDIAMPLTLGTFPNEQYMAMGDNSFNSSDSRSWGPVPRQNVVGPGWFCYWPLTKHWGPID